MDLSAFVESFQNYLPNILTALVILLLGVVAGWLLSAFIGWLVKRTGLHRRLSKEIDTRGDATTIRHWIVTITFLLVMVVALVPVLDVLQIPTLSGPLAGFVENIVTYLPNLAGAGLLLLLAWAVAVLVRALIRQAGALAKLPSVETGDQQQSLDEVLANAAYYLVFLLFLPAILDVLQLPGLLQPVQNMVNDFLTVLPNVLAAGLIIGVGYVVARLVQRLVENATAALGVDKLVTAVLPGGTEKPSIRVSHILGIVTHILVLLPAVVAALNALNLEAVTVPVSNMLNEILAAVPNMLTAAAIVIVALLAGRWISDILTNFLSSIHFDSWLQSMSGSTISIPGKSDVRLSRIVGNFAMVGIVVLASLEAAEVLGWDSVTALLSAFSVFLGQVVLGAVVFILGLFLAHLAADFVRASNMPSADRVASLVRVIVLLLAGAMALQQMGIASTIITAVLSVILAGLAIAFALAFGLGGRDVAGRKLSEWVESGKGK